MGCFAFVIMFFLMIVGTIAWLEGGLWIPAICWVLAGLAGTFSVMLASYPAAVDDAGESSFDDGAGPDLAGLDNAEGGRLAEAEEEGESERRAL